MTTYQARRMKSSREAPGRGSAKRAIKSPRRRYRLLKSIGTFDRICFTVSWTVQGGVSDFPTARDQLRRPCCERGLSNTEVGKSLQGPLARLMRRSLNMKCCVTYLDDHCMVDPQQEFWFERRRAGEISQMSARAFASD